MDDNEAHAGQCVCGATLELANHPSYGGGGMCAECRKKPPKTIDIEDFGDPIYSGPYEYPVGFASKTDIEPGESATLGGPTQVIARTGKRFKARKLIVPRSCAPHFTIDSIDWGPERVLKHSRFDICF